MQNVDELCIKYVLNELDPSEVLLVEKAMQEDENILIEIESLRCTLRKLNDLPEHTPPAEIREKIMEVARDHAASNTSRFGALWQQTGFYAAAAVLILGIGFGMFQFTGQSTDSGELNATVSGTMQSAEQPMSAAAAGDLSQAATPQTGNSNVEPWVDRRNILHINVTSGPDGFGVLSSEKSGKENSPLRPVDAAKSPQQHSFPAMRDIHLTRTQP